VEAQANVYHAYIWEAIQAQPSQDGWRKIPQGEVKRVRLVHSR
jgi:hypothetical protein